jgi:hypothetical protein
MGKVGSRLFSKNFVLVMINFLRYHPRTLRENFMRLIHKTLDITPNGPILQT